MDSLREKFSLWRSRYQSRRSTTQFSPGDSGSSDDRSRRHRGRRTDRANDREPPDSGKASGRPLPAGTTITHKVVVMGPPRCGKSALINQFLYDTFNPKYKRTIEEMHHGEFDVNGVHLNLQILDTSGENEFPAMRELSITSSDAFILVYDLTDSSTFEVVRSIRDQILEKKGIPTVPIVVVGNKLDLVGGGREVELSTTESVVTVDWENGFVETSAKNSTNVCKVFQELLNQAEVRYDLSPALNLRRKRRQSLPHASAAPAVTVPPSSSSAHASPAPRHSRRRWRSGQKDSLANRSSCILS